MRKIRRLARLAAQSVQCPRCYAWYDPTYGHICPKG